MYFKCFFNDFNILILKIIFLKKYYFNIFIINTEICDHEGEWDMHPCVPHP